MDYYSCLQLSSWFEELGQALRSNEIANSVEASEQLLEQFAHQQESTNDATASTISEGETLLEELRNAGMTTESDTTGSYGSIEATTKKLAKSRDDLQELWAQRKLKLDMCLQLRLFERDALEVRPSLPY